MTEGEAKQRWCPFARVAAGHTTFNRWSSGEAVGDGSPSLCLGSACMAWRFGQKRNPDWKPTHSMVAGYPAHPDDGPRPYVVDKETGYCGLAGRPS